VDSDCRLDAADPATAVEDDELVELCRLPDSDIFGVSSFRPLEGDSAEKRLWLWV
jgi:hypothetical protein